MSERPDLDAIRQRSADSGEDRTEFLYITEHDVPDLLAYIAKLEFSKSVEDAQREKIARDLDGIMSWLHTMHDITKVLPHPYDAVDDMALRMLHDFPGFAFTLKRVLGITT